ncbi:MAG: hypothetical protein ACI9YL_001584 [Luteibaculaceae bacterium]|jgi:hypothetical protein
MVSKYFQINNPFLQALFPLILFFIWWPISWSSPGDVVVGNLWFELLRTGIPLWDKIIAFSSIVFLSILFNSLLNKNDLVQKLRYFPGFACLFLLGITTDQMNLNPLHFANVFVLLALGFALQLNQKGSVQRPVFLAGLFIGLAGLFYPPYFVITLAFPIILTSLKGWSFRYFMWVILGVLFPLFFIGGAEFALVGSLDFLRGIFISPEIFSLEIDGQFGMPPLESSILLFLVVLLSAVGSIQFFRIRAGNILRIQQRMWAVYLFFLPLFILFVVAYFIGQNFQIGIIAFPLAYLAYGVLSEVKSELLRDALMFLFFGLLVYI